MRTPQEKADARADRIADLRTIKAILRPVRDALRQASLDLQIARAAHRAARPRKK